MVKKGIKFDMQKDTTTPDDNTVFVLTSRFA